MNNILFSSKYDSWTTPKDLFNKLNSIYHFDIDACASKDNALCNEFYSESCSILDQRFTNKNIYMNPPYSRYMYKFIKWCADMQKYNNIVLLVPARTDTKWFHDFIYNKVNVKIEFIKGRLKFGNSNSPAPFPSMIIYFNKLNN